MSYRNLFSERLGQLRKEKGMSYAELGKQLGVSDEAVRLMEKSKRSPSFEMLCSIAELFDVPVDYLLGRGLFSNWDKIILYRDYICEKIEPYCPLMQITSEGKEPKIMRLDLKSLDEKDFMLALSTLIEHIEIIEEDDKPQSFNIVFRPLWSSSDSGPTVPPLLN